MPYIKDADFARLGELIQLIKELAQKDGNSPIPDITERVLRIMNGYRGQAESHSSPRGRSDRKQP